MKIIDRLTTLRSEISDDESAVARLLDILIEVEDEDPEDEKEIEVEEEIEVEDGNPEDDWDHEDGVDE